MSRVKGSKKGLRAGKGRSGKSSDAAVGEVAVGSAGGSAGGSADGSVREAANERVAEQNVEGIDALAFDMKAATEAMREVVSALLSMSPAEARKVLEDASEFSREITLGAYPELRLKLALGWYPIRRFSGGEKLLMVGFPSLGRLKRVLSALGDATMELDAERITNEVRALEQAECHREDEEGKRLWSRRKALVEAVFSNYEEGDELDVPFSVIEEGVRDFFLGYSLRKKFSPKKLAELERYWENMSKEVQENIVG